MPRSFCIPGVFFLLCAFVLLVLTSISLPFLPVFDITRVHFNTHNNAVLPTVGGNNGSISELRLGVWAYCADASANGDRTCSPTGHAYSVNIESGQTNGGGVTINPAWTRGLAVHPVAAGVTFIALLFSLSTHLVLTLIASILSFLAAAITLVAFAIDIALYAFVKDRMGNLTRGSQNTITGPGFWLTFASLILLLLAGCTVCFGRRRDRMSGATSYPVANGTTAPRKGGFLGRFRRNRY